MTTKNTPANLGYDVTQALKPMIVGAFIGLILITFFLFSDDTPNPEWPSNYMLKPMIVVPLAGAMGGALFYMLRPLRMRGGWLTAFGYLLGIFGFIVVLWLGSVFGLNGTYWD